MVSKHPRSSTSTRTTTTTTTTTTRRPHQMASMPRPPPTPDQHHQDSGSGPGMSLLSRYNNNLKVLRRRDPTILSIFDQFSHVCLYHHNGMRWEKKGYEGSMFLFEREHFPQYGLYILNRMGMEDYIQPILPEDDLLVQGSYLLYRSYPEYSARRLGIPVSTLRTTSDYADYSSENDDDDEDRDGEAKDGGKEGKGKGVTVGLWMFPTDAREPLTDVFVRLHSYIQQDLPYPDEFRYGPDRPPPPNSHLKTVAPSTESRSSPEDSSHHKAEVRSPKRAHGSGPNPQIVQRRAQEQARSIVASASPAPHQQQPLSAQQIQTQISSQAQPHHPGQLSELDKLFAKLTPNAASTSATAAESSSSTAPQGTMSVDSLFAALSGQHQAGQLPEQPSASSQPQSQVHSQPSIHDLFQAASQAQVQTQAQAQVSAPTPARGLALLDTIFASASTSDSPMTSRPASQVQHPSLQPAAPLSIQPQPQPQLQSYPKPRPPVQFPFIPGQVQSQIHARRASQSQGQVQAQYIPYGEHGHGHERRGSQVPEILSPKPTSSALPQILNPGSIDSLLAMAASGTASASGSVTASLAVADHSFDAHDGRAGPVGSRSSSSASFGSRGSTGAGRVYEGDNEEDGEDAEEEEYSETTTVLDMADGDINPDTGMSYSEEERDLEEGQIVEGEWVDEEEYSGGGFVNGDVTPRPPVRGMGGMPNMLSPATQEFSLPSMPVSVASTIRQYRKESRPGLRSLPSSSSTIRLGQDPTSPTFTSPSQHHGQEASTSALKPPTPSSAALGGFVSGGEDVWATLRGVREAGGEEDAVVVELDFKDTSALSDLDAFEKKLKKSKRNKEREERRKEREKGKEKEKEKVAQVQTRDVVQEMDRVLVERKEPVVNGKGKEKARENGVDVGGKIDSEAVSVALADALALQINGGVGQTSDTGLSKNDFVREVLTLIHTDKSFVDRLWHNYASRTR